MNCQEANMLERVHEHLLAEIENGNRTDTIVVVVALLFNVLALCSNSSVAAIFWTSGFTSGDVASLGVDLYLAVFVLITLAINAIALVGLIIGRQVRQKLLVGLVAMYSDNQVDKYYDKSLLASYRNRYLIFGGVMIVFAIASIAAPLILRLFRVQ
jgi:hypothetical protein